MHGRPQVGGRGEHLPPGFCVKGAQLHNTDFILAMIRNKIWCKAEEVRLVRTYIRRLLREGSFLFKNCYSTAM